MIAAPPRARPRRHRRVRAADPGRLQARRVARREAGRMSHQHARHVGLGTVVAHLPGRVAVVAAAGLHEVLAVSQRATRPPAPTAPPGRSDGRCARSAARRATAGWRRGQTMDVLTGTSWRPPVGQRADARVCGDRPGALGNPPPQQGHGLRVDDAAAERGHLEYGMTRVHAGQQHARVGVARRDAVAQVGTGRGLEVTRLGQRRPQRGRGAPAACASGYCSTKPSDAISPAPVWHMPQLACR